MNSHEFNKMNMFTAVNAVLHLNSKAIAKIDMLSEASGRFDEKLAHISRRDARYTTVSAGATASKNNAADTLADLTLRIANALLVLGNITENEQLRTECRLNPSNLRHIRIINLVKICNRIGELARQYAAELPSYGISKQDISLHTETIESFRQKRDEQQQRLTEGKSARGMLYDDFTEANDILRNQIDPLMELVKHSDTGFYNQYRAARVIRDLHGRGSRNITATVIPETADTETDMVSETVAV